METQNINLTELQQNMFLTIKTFCQNSLEKIIIRYDTQTEVLDIRILDDYFYVDSLPTPKKYQTFFHKWYPYELKIKETCKIISNYFKLNNQMKNPFFQFELDVRTGNIKETIYDK